MDALLTTLPADSSYRVMATILPGRPANASVLQLPKTGEGTWYIAQGALQINVVPIKQINWNGDASDFPDGHPVRRQCGVHVRWKGTVTPDGSVRAEITPVGVERAPFGRTIEGSLRSWK